MATPKRGDRKLTPVAGRVEAEQDDNETNGAGRPGRVGLVDRPVDREVSNHRQPAAPDRSRVSDRRH